MGATNPAVNPYIVKGTDLPATQLPGGGITSKGGYSVSAEPVANAAGEINASSRKDAMQQISNIIAQARSGQIEKQASKVRHAKLNDLAEEIRNAHVQQNAANFGTLGEEITNEIRTTIARTGFIRRFAQERELVAGEETKVYIRKQDTLAFSMSTDGQTPVSHIKQREVYLRENYVNGHIQIEEKEISRLRADLLAEKLEDGFEMLMVQEDRQWKVLSDQAASALNVPIFFPTLSPAVFQALKNQVESRGLPVATAWLANNLWNDIVADNTFSQWFDPVHKHELILNGEIGSLLGVTLETDAFINSQLRVLNPGEIFFYSAPVTLGQLLIRKTLTSEPINKNVLGIPARGWFLSEIIAPVIVNVNGVAKGTRA